MATPSESIRSTLRSIEPYHAAIKTLVALNLLGWAVFELWAYLEAANGLAWSHDGRWTARTSVWVALLLFDVLAVVWWHADVACRQLRLAETTRAEINKPFVVIDRKRSAEAEPAAGGCVRYTVRNIGPGLAVNVFYVVEDDAGLAIRSIGALAGLGERALSEALESPFRDARAAHQFVIVSEGVVSQPSRWTVTANVLLPTGEVAHRVVWLEPEKRSDSLRQWLEWHWPAVKTQIAILENQK